MIEGGSLKTALHFVSPTETTAADRSPAEKRLDRLEGVYREHQLGVFRAAYRLTGSADDAEDVVQTVFSRLLAKQNEVELGDAWAPYLHRAAVNGALDVLRAKARWSSLEEPDGQPSGRCGPEAETRLREQKAQLRHALAKEPRRSAEMFALRYFEGYRNTEIADMFGTSRASVAVTLHRVRARLKKVMGGGS